MAPSKETRKAARHEAMHCVMAFLSNYPTEYTCVLADCGDTVIVLPAPERLAQEWRAAEQNRPVVYVRPLAVALALGRAEMSAQDEQRVADFEAAFPGTASEWTHIRLLSEQWARQRMDLFTDAVDHLGALLALRGRLAGRPLYRALHHAVSCLAPSPCSCWQLEDGHFPLVSEPYISLPA